MPKRARDSGEFGGVRVEAEEWPVLHVVLPAEVTADAREAYSDFTSELRYRKPGPYVVVFETAGPISDSQRGLIVSGPGAGEDGADSPCYGAAVIVPSWLQRVMARLSLGSAPHSVHVAPSRTDAVRWGRRRLRERGVFEQEADSIVGDVNDLSEPPTVEALAVPVPDADGNHWVEIAIFVSERRAHLRADTMLDQGLVTVVREIPGGARPGFAVQLGPFAEEQLAQRARDAILDFVPAARVVAR